MKFDFDELTGLFINGEWRKDGKSKLAVRHKATGAVLAKLVTASGDHVQEAVDSARRAMAAQPLTAYDRYRILTRTWQLIEEHADEISLLLAQEGGKPLRDAKMEVSRSVQTVMLSSEEAKRIHGEGLPLDGMPGTGNRIGFTIRVPVGVIAAIAPFNYPLNLVVHKVAPALAAGNTVVLKPASTTPLMSVILCRILTEAGLPAGYINLVVGSGSEIGDALVTAEGVRMVTFTGSPGIGERIKAISGLRKITLELGNNSPNIVHHDADLDQAAKILTQRAYAQAGQSCVSVQRIYVQRDVYSPFAEKMKREIAQLKEGPLEDLQTDIGPLISEQEAIRVESWIERAVADGAELICGGKRNGAYVGATLLANPSKDSDVVCNEVFGPVASIIPYDTIEEAIELSNDTRYGLQAGIFTSDIKTAWKAVKELEYGGVIVNDASSYRLDLMPYGGVKESGIGREGPRYAVEEMTEVRNAIFNLN